MPRTKQTATKPRAKSASKATKSRSRTPKRDIVFTKGTVVAIPGKDYEMNFKLVQVPIVQFSWSLNIIIA